ncbi:TPA: hypothetical protein N0F65_001070 [Lagenidium giganteum]|uniref:Uncharacterized protein n=1 Tax=Lagenidium giganteum TaxID=4803 RepID=A0AAV2YGN4_9STRA|nr:TPA: hypothetical protein N0F65_001070 [Lagenidium giganteum]
MSLDMNTATLSAFERMKDCIAATVELAHRATVCMFTDVDGVGRSLKLNAGQTISMSSNNPISSARVPVVPLVVYS